MELQNLVLVFNRGLSRILMCKRSKAPYQGLFNLVEGKVEAGKEGITAAYRELQEETSVTKESITLLHLMDLIYYLHDRKLEVYVGRLQADIPVSGEENERFWLPIQDFRCASGWLAGDGNIQHVLSYTLALIEENQLFL